MTNKNYICTLHQAVNFQINNEHKIKSFFHLFYISCIKLCESFFNGKVSICLYQMTEMLDPKKPVFIIEGLINITLIKDAINNAVFFESLEDFKKTYTNLAQYEFIKYSRDLYKKQLIEYIDYEYLNVKRPKLIALWRLFNSNKVIFSTSRITDTHFEIEIRKMPNLLHPIKLKLTVPNVNSIDYNDVVNMVKECIIETCKKK